MLVGVQLSVLGLYLPPVLKPASGLRPRRSFRCRSTPLCAGIGHRARWWCWWQSNCRCWDCICRQCSDGDGVGSAPDDHFAAGPDCRVTGSASGRVGGAGGGPTVSDGIVLSAGVQNRRCRHIHPTRSFRCRSILPCDRIGQRVHWWCGCSPSVIDAATEGLSYYRKHVGRFRPEQRPGHVSSMSRRPGTAAGGSQ